MGTSNVKNTVEIIGIFAVVAGLFFVYEELRLSRTIARAEMSATTNAMLSELESLERDPAVSALLIKSSESPEDLTPVERRQMNSILDGVLGVYARERYNYVRGIFEEWTSLIAFSAPKYFGRGYGRVYWDVKKTHPEMPQFLITAIDDALENQPYIEFEQRFDAEVLKRLQQ
jgi:hypothetical protein